MQDEFSFGQRDFVLDYCENAPFASIGGLEARRCPRAPLGIPSDGAVAYVAGYTTKAREVFGEYWQTCDDLKNVASKPCRLV